MENFRGKTFGSIATLIFIIGNVLRFQISVHAGYSDPIMGIIIYQIMIPEGETELLSPSGIQKRGLPHDSVETKNSLFARVGV